MAAGTQIFPDMTPNGSLPTGSWVPFVDESTDGSNQRYDLGARFLATDASIALRPTSATLLASAGSSLVGFIEAGGGAVQQTVQDMLRRMPLFPESFGATGGNLSADTAGWIACIAAAKAEGRPIYAGDTTYAIGTQLELQADTFTDNYAPGYVIIGAGEDITNFDNRVANGALFNLSSTTPNNFMRGGLLRGFTILTTNSPANSYGITIRSTFNFDFVQIRVKGMTLDGIRVICEDGDLDASNCLGFIQCKFEFCLRWGTNTAADLDHNEISFLTFSQCRWESNGTAGVADPPTSGGAIHKGQVAIFYQPTWVTNFNVGLYIPGEGGLANTLGLIQPTFENNRIRSFYCRGLNSGYMLQPQFYNNDDHTNSVQCELQSAVAIRNFIIQNPLIRATAGNNPITAFKIGGAGADLQSCRVRNVTWENFDHAGQTRFEGWVFDPIPIQAQFVAESSTSSNLKGWNGAGGVVPLRLRGSGSTTGEWVPFQVPAAGLAVTNAGLANNTTYYAYLWDNNGSTAIELDTDVPTIDAASGYSVKTGDATRFWIGGVTTNGSAQFNTTGNGWLTATRIAGSQVSAYLWTDATGDLRIKPIAPASDTDGTIVGTQS